MASRRPRHPPRSNRRPSRDRRHLGGRRRSVARVRRRPPPPARSPTVLDLGAQATQPPAQVGAKPPLDRLERRVAPSTSTGSSRRPRDVIDRATQQRRRVFPRRRYSHAQRNLGHDYVTLPASTTAKQLPRIRQTAVLYRGIFTADDTLSTGTDTLIWTADSEPQTDICDKPEPEIQSRDSSDVTVTRCSLYSPAHAHTHTHTHALLVLSSNQEQLASMVHISLSATRWSMDRYCSQLWVIQEICPPRTSAPGPTDR